MTNITYADKVDGQEVTSANMNEIKAATNSKQDGALTLATIGAGTLPLTKPQLVGVAPVGSSFISLSATLEEVFKIVFSTLAQDDYMQWDLANFRVKAAALAPFDPDDFVLSADLVSDLEGTYVTTKSLIMQVFGPTADVVVGDGALYFELPSDLNGLILKRVRFFHSTAGTTGSSTFQVHAPGGDVLTTVATIAAGATGPSTGQVIGTSFYTAATDAQWRIDVKTKTTTAAKGLRVNLEFGA